MDKDIFRIILAVLGVLLVSGIYVWDRIKTRRRGEIDELPVDEVQPFDAVSEEDSFSMIPAGNTNLVADIDSDLPSFHAYGDGIDQADINHSDEFSHQDESSAASEITDDQLDIVQLYVVAHGDMLFPGKALVEAFEALGLEYGDMKIFHRVVPGTEFPHFSIVNMVEPGTFPAGDYATFQSPGVALFLQTALVKEPQEVFDDMLQTASALAARLRGELLDSARKPVTLETIQTLRDSLAS